MCDWAPIPCDVGDGLYPAASFMTFQQACFNFGHTEFRSAAGIRAAMFTSAAASRLQPDSTFWTRLAR